MEANILTVKKGYVGSNLVIAYEYTGMDEGLSHYTYKGKKHAGLVAFSNPFSTETITY